LEASVHPDVIRFDAYEMRLPTQELFKHELRIKLAPQAFQILRMLLERPGELVTREELQKALWSVDTFVDFDHGLNNAIKRIRDVLSDTPENPRYIETLPRLGYRFVGEIKKPATPFAKHIGVSVTQDQAVNGRRWLAFLVFGFAATLTGLVALRWQALRPWHANVQVKSLAVLPLENLSGDPAQDYFSDGITEALITELGKLDNPRVISRQSIMRYKGTRKSLQEITKELSVDTVLGGAFKRSGDRIRVTLSLSAANSEHQIWAREYDRNVRDTLDLQDDIARSVAAAIQVKLAPQDLAGLSRRQPPDPQAQDDYLHGRYFAHRNTERDTETAIAYYQQAIVKDRGYALAYAALADAYFTLVNPWVPGHSPKEALPLAKAAALKAVQLDPSIAEGHIALGWSLLQDWNWQEAEKEARLAIRLNPSDPSAHFLNSTYLSVVGQHDESISEMKYAIQLDPLNSDYQHELGWTAYRAHQFEFGIKQFKSLDDNPGLAAIYLAEKKYGEVIAALEADIAHLGRRSASIAFLAEAYGRSGKKDKARKLLNELNETARHGYVSPFLLAGVYVGLEERDRALTWIEKGYEDHDEWAIFMKTAAGLDSLRDERRFQAVLKRMNFPH
jgi:TolB-like protein/DNA-binding winged helix-turn-helix (wHTH) protein